MKDIRLLQFNLPSIIVPYYKLSLKYHKIFLYKKILEECSRSNLKINRITLLQEF